eukprot:TRINITY_DN8674_c0_g1_i2.p1 TRINITY_DN8674_c0_g1~~TRINITY_DN8674_c0_g1_i2.p1  ORF type:complete len:134 (-),score=37.08 TRINITY_DN8674_c0_g1_i2:100-444(-)
MCIRDRSMMHFSQLINDPKGIFKKFDYGHKNQQVYGSPTPPIYDLSAIKTKVYMLVGTQDRIADATDASRLRDELPNHEYKEIHHGHVSMIFAASTDVTDYVLEILGRDTKLMN